MAGAVHIPLAELGLHAHQIPRDKIAVTICGKVGGRSAEGVDMLRNLGHPEALWLEGGTSGWLQLSTRKKIQTEEIPMGCGIIIRIPQIEHSSDPQRFALWQLQR